MKELLEFITLKLVDHPEDVIINEKTDGGFTQLTLKVNPEDMGKIIGKEGKIIKSLRHLLHLAALKNHYKVNLTLEDQEFPQ
jgi:hypothetical protein